MSSGIFDANSQVFLTLAMITGGLLGVFVVVGTIWQVIRFQMSKKPNPGRVPFNMRSSLLLLYVAIYRCFCTLHFLRT